MTTKKKFDHLDYPRPDFYRRNWMSLDGEWEFSFDGETVPKVFPLKIKVPYVYECARSGLGLQEKHERVWYARTFPGSIAPSGERIRLCFGAVDYHAEVWLNGEYLGSHTGGYTPFSFDITDKLAESNRLVVKVTDPFDRFQPRGKQYCAEKIDRCWYTESTGIWQPVWLQGLGARNIEYALFTPNLNTRTVQAEVFVENFTAGLKVRADVSFAGKPVLSNEYSLPSKTTKITFDIREEDPVDEIHIWSPEHPNLYDVTLRLMDGENVLDEVETYFGMRSIEVFRGKVLLNNRILYQRLILDQGYYADCLLTPPDFETVVNDMNAVKAMGFNGVRRHQVISDPRFYYLADKMGLLVWEEMPSPYEFSEESIKNFLRDLPAYVMRDYNHPAVIAWCPLNESWGVRNVAADARQQSLVRSLYHTLKALDGTRLVVGNDGWEYVLGDFLTVHNYSVAGERFSEIVSGANGEYTVGAASGYKPSLARGVEFPEVPVILSEFGGIAMTQDNGWGYHSAAESEEAFYKRFEDLIREISRVKSLQGYCYTQLTDVFQETNGLMNMQRMFKVDPERIRKIVMKYRSIWDNS